MDYVLTVLAALDDEFLCPICLSLLDTTMTTMECMHRFCQECILKSLRYSKQKECPTCRHPLPASKRSLRPDPEFDQIIAEVYPSRNVFDQQQSELLEKMRLYGNPQALAASVEEGIRRQVKPPLFCVCQRA